MGWHDLFNTNKGKKEKHLTREESIKTLITPKAVAGNGNQITAEVLQVTLKKGAISGEGTYTITTSKNYSRSNLTSIGLVEHADFNRTADQFFFFYEIKQKPLEDALSKAYGVSFPSIQRNS
jgi:hypothetical protein